MDPAWSAGHPGAATGIFGTAEDYLTSTETGNNSFLSFRSKHRRDPEGEPCEKTNGEGHLLDESTGEHLDPAGLLQPKSLSLLHQPNKLLLCKGSRSNPEGSSSRSQKET
ncbi:hypothetical protein INR49_030824 [Caranx melampygus]|nr:hypothetical protein INR49_030824 [Caranx melampygus]